MKTVYVTGAAALLACSAAMANHVPTTNSSLNPAVSVQPADLYCSGCCAGASICCSGCCAGCVGACCAGSCCAGSCVGDCVACSGCCGGGDGL